MLRIRVNVMEFGRFTTKECCGGQPSTSLIILLRYRERNPQKNTGVSRGELPSVPVHPLVDLTVGTGFAQGRKQAFSHLQEVRLLWNRAVGCQLVYDRG